MNTFAGLVGGSCSCSCPRMLLCRKPRGGSISREALQTRFRQFAEASGSLSSSSREMFQKLPAVRWCAEGGAVPGMTRSGEQPGPKFFVQMGELSIRQGCIGSGGSCSRFGSHVAAVAEPNPEATSRVLISMTLTVNRNR